MLDNLKKKLFFKRFDLLFNKGVRDGRICEFDDQIYEKMDGTIVSCLPVSMYIKHSDHLFPSGTCYERSLYMFLALGDGVLVRGNDKALEYRCGEGHGGHGWVEVGDYVYDPSLMLRFDRNLYYNLYGMSDVYKCDKKTYLAEHHDYFDSHVSHDLDEFKPGGKRRLELGFYIMQLRALESLVNDDSFTHDLESYLELVEYDEAEISAERDKAIQKIFENRPGFTSISGEKN